MFGVGTESIELIVTGLSNLCSQVAQGRVWLGQQAIHRGLVDRIGGLHTALQLAANLSDSYLPESYRRHYADLKAGVAQQKESAAFRKYPQLRVEIISEPSYGGFRKALRRRVSEEVTELATSSPLLKADNQPLAVMDSSVRYPSLVPEAASLGGVGGLLNKMKLFAAQLLANDLR